MDFSSVSDVPPTHGHNEPTRAIITPRGDSTAHTSAHPLVVLSVNARFTSFLRNGDIMRACVKCSVWRALTWFVTNHSTSRECTPGAIRVLLRVASDGQMDEQADGQRVVSAVRLSPPQFYGIQGVLSSQEQCLAQSGRNSC